MSLNKSCFIVVEDTDSYAGNFERELVAYMTGLVGDCHVGKEYAEIAQADSAALGFDDEYEETFFGLPLAIRVDEQCRPASIWEEGNNSVAVAFKEDLTEAQFNLLAERAKSFKPLKKYGPDFKVLGVRAIKRVRARATDTQIFSTL